MTVKTALEAVDKAKVLLGDEANTSDALDLLMRAMPFLKAEWGK